MNKIHEFVNEIYPRILWIVVDSEETVKDCFLHDDDSLIEDESFKDAFATTISVVEKSSRAGRGIVIHFSRRLLDEGGSQIVSTISHESVHAANQIFTPIGVSYTMYSDEHFAYLVGWVAKKCWLVLQEYVKTDK
jgi:hypothetical protein